MRICQQRATRSKDLGAETRDMATARWAPHEIVNGFRTGQMTDRYKGGNSQEEPDMARPKATINSVDLTRACQSHEGRWADDQLC